MNKERRAYSAQELRSLHKMIADGVSYEDIAQKLGRTVCAVRSQQRIRRAKEIKRAANARAGKVKKQKTAKPQEQMQVITRDGQTTLAELVINSDLSRSAKLALLNSLV